MAGIDELLAIEPDAVLAISAWVHLARAALSFKKDGQADLTADVQADLTADARTDLTTDLEEEAKAEAAWRVSVRGRVAERLRVLGERDPLRRHMYEDIGSFLSSSVQK